MKDMVSSPKSSLMYQCAPIYNSIYKCFYATGVKKNEILENQQKNLRKYLSYKNRFIFKSCEEDIKESINNPSNIEDVEKSFRVSLQIFTLI